jgi:outer membrane receptor protein involved in Fe transport
MLCASISRRISALRVLVALMIFAAPSAVRAQVAGGTILGTVSDSTGAIVPRASVSIRNVATGVARDVTTDSAGLYSVPNLLPGAYEVTASATGFSTLVRSGITLAVGQTMELNLTLQVGTISQKVEVTAAAPLVQTATSTVSEQVSETTVRQLPLNGRDWAQLATLQPGISSVRNQSAVGTVAFGDVNRVLRGFGNQLSVSGTRPQENTYRVDGININDYTNGAPGGVLGDLTGVDAIREFEVLTTNYSAEYGRTSGGVINAITSSGTNAFHGDVYEFLRNSSLDAANFFDNFNSVVKAPFRRNQFGGAVGGPIKKDKAFFFFNYEGLRQNLDTTQTDTVPSLNARNGTLFPIDPAVAPFLAFWPAPNGPTLGPPATAPTALFSVVTAQVGTENYYSARVDEVISQKDTLAASFYYDHSQLTEPDSLNQVTALNSNSRPFGSLEETHTFSPTLVNSARIGFNRNYAVSTTTDAINPLANNPSLGSVPGHPAPFIVVPGIQTFDGGLGGFPNFEEGWNSFQFYDDVFWTRGAHSVKFGAAVERAQLNDRWNASENGTFVFPDLPSFLANKKPSVYEAELRSTERGFRETLVGGYLQDDWRYKPNLTLNLGLRYEMATNPTEVHNLFGFLRNFTDSQVTIGSPFTSNPTTKNFEPRVGFAWDPSGQGKTAIRGGFGMFDVLPLPYYFVILAAGTAPGTAVSIVGGPGLPAAGSFPTQAFTIASNAVSPNSLAGLRTALIQPSPSRDYVMEWNLNIQHEVAPSTTLAVGYIGSRGVHLPYRTDDADIVIPTLTPQGYLWPPLLPSGAGSGTPINTSVGRIDYLQFGADSWYDGLEVGITKRMSHGVQIQGAYTWGKTIDTGSSTIAGDQFANSPSSLPLWFDPRTRRGIADFSLGQNLVINGIWDIPAPGSPSGLVGGLVKGWQAGGIFEASTGAPFPVVMGVGSDPLGMNNADPWDYPDRLGGPGCSSPVNPGNPFYVKTNCFAAANPINRLGNAGRNPLTGPGLVNLDFSLFKNFPVKRVSETAQVQFRAEFFNILNRANFAPPIDNFGLFNPDGSLIGGAGLIDATQTPPREIQFGLKIVW